MEGSDPHDLAWRVERACRAAWPPRATETVSDWIIGLSGGGTKRINSASAARPGATLAARTIARIAARYATAEQPAIVRVTTLDEGADAALDAAGFAAPEAPTHTLACDLSHRTYPASEASLDPAPSPDWQHARRALSRAVGAGVEDHLAPALRLAIPPRFAAMTRDGAIRSLAFAAVHDRIAVIEAVATDPRYRAQGLARACLHALLAWANGAGAHHAALQVAQDNTPALALYRALGFDRPLHDYHYRRRAA